MATFPTLSQALYLPENAPIWQQVAEVCRPCKSKPSDLPILQKKKRQRTGCATCNSPPPRCPDVKSVYTFGRFLGRGTYGTTYLAVHNETGQEVAIKSICKQTTDHDKHLERIRHELEVLHTMDGHDNIVRLIENFEDETHVHLVLELCTGGELFDRLASQGCYSEREAAQLFYDILQAVAYCHSLGVVHRDLKPENFLFSNSSSPAKLKLADFGGAAFFTPGHMLTERVGSCYYVAPEVLKGEYNCQADVWSAGVVLYVLLCGWPPFYGGSDMEVFKAIMKAKVDLTCGPWKTISETAKDCVLKMLVKNPRKRATATEMLMHPWFAQCQTYLPSCAGDIICGRLRIFAAMSEVQRLACTMAVRSLPGTETAGLHHIYDDIAVDAIAAISVDSVQTWLVDRGACPEDVTFVRSIADSSGAITVDTFLAAMLSEGKMQRIKAKYPLLFSANTLQRLDSFSSLVEPVFTCNKTPSRHPLIKSPVRLKRPSSCTALPAAGVEFSTPHCYIAHRAHPRTAEAAAPPIPTPVFSKYELRPCDSPRRGLLSDFNAHACTADACVGTSMADSHAPELHTSHAACILHDTQPQPSSTCTLHDTQPQPSSTCTLHDTQPQPSSTCTLHDTQPQPSSTCTLHDTQPQPSSTCTLHDTPLQPSSTCTLHDTPPQPSSTCTLHDTQPRPSSTCTLHDTQPQLSSTCTLYDTQTQPSSSCTPHDTQPRPSSTCTLYDTQPQPSSTCTLQDTHAQPPSTCAVDASLAAAAHVAACSPCVDDQSHGEPAGNIHAPTLTPEPSIDYGKHPHGAVPEITPSHSDYNEEVDCPVTEGMISTTFTVVGDCSSFSAHTVVPHTHGDRDADQHTGVVPASTTPVSTASPPSTTGAPTACDGTREAAFTCDLDSLFPSSTAASLSTGDSGDCSQSCSSNFGTEGNAACVQASCSPAVSHLMHGPDRAPIAECAHITEHAHIDECSHIPELAHMDECSHIPELAHMDECSHITELAHIDELADLTEHAHNAKSVHLPDGRVNASHAPVDMDVIPVSVDLAPDRDPTARTSADTHCTQSLECDQTAGSRCEAAQYSFQPAWEDAVTGWIEHHSPSAQAAPSPGCNEVASSPALVEEDASVITDEPPPALPVPAAPARARERLACSPAVAFEPIVVEIYRRHDESDVYTSDDEHLQYDAVRAASNDDGHLQYNAVRAASRDGQYNAAVEEVVELCRNYDMQQVCGQDSWDLLLALKCGPAAASVYASSASCGSLRSFPVMCESWECEEFSDDEDSGPEDGAFQSAVCYDLSHGVVSHMIECD